MVVTQPQSTRVEEPTLLCNQVKLGKTTCTVIRLIRSWPRSEVKLAGSPDKRWYPSRMATLSEAFGPVICAWCHKQLKVGDPTKPVSHGICMVCLGSVIDISVEDVRHIPSEVLDVLPFGVIRLTGEGTITGYNKMESSFSGLDPSRIIGKSFFSGDCPVRLGEGVRWKVCEAAVFEIRRTNRIQIRLQVSSWGHAREHSDRL